jgi:L-aspartate oxidase
MWNYVGIVRSDKRLRAPRAASRCSGRDPRVLLEHLVTRDLLELRNIATVAQLIVECASARRESRGLHYTIDYPARCARLLAEAMNLAPSRTGAWACG